MTQNISLNQFSPNSPVAGMYAYAVNAPQLHNVIVSKNQVEVLSAGAVLTLDKSVVNSSCPVVKQAKSGDAVFGVLAYTPVQNVFKANDRVCMAREHEIIWMLAASDVKQGDVLYFDENNSVTATSTEGATLGVAITSAMQGNYVQVELKFSMAV